MKKVIFILSLFTLIYSCTKKESDLLNIGQKFQGGIVAYLLKPEDPGYDKNIQHGLIAATSDQSTAIMWSLEYIIKKNFISTEAIGTAIGTGLTNTNKIIASQGATDTRYAELYAAGLTRAYKGGGYTDWYLPSKDELRRLYINKLAIGGFANSNYWSSTEVGGGAAWVQSFDNGVQNGLVKSNSFYVRAIRSF
jgi:hypothetical protein